ncbi:MAG TPA: TIGR00725 family protein [Actinomycetota bacterium]|nr:TIGR00725 family protein [Actinomycetota bacterium]
MTFSAYVAVVGGSNPSDDELGAAHAIGYELARRGALVVCGGLSGVMEAVCAGAKEGGGTTVGLLPGDDRAAANRFVDVALATGLGEARNTIVARAVDVVVAVGGEFGTLSEIAFALRAGTPVVGLGTWELRRRGRPVDAIVAASSPRDAVETALRLARGR